MRAYRGSNSKDGTLLANPSRGVFYFTMDPWQADNYGRYVHQYDLALKNPFHTKKRSYIDQFNVNGMDMRELEEQEYNSVIYDVPQIEEPSQIVVFDQAQAHLQD